MISVSPKSKSKPKKGSEKKEEKKKEGTPTEDDADLLEEVVCPLDLAALHDLLRYRISQVEELRNVRTSQALEIEEKSNAIETLQKEKRALGASNSSTPF